MCYLNICGVKFENATIEGKNLREIYETRNLRDVMEMVRGGRFDINHRDIVKIRHVVYALENTI